MGEAATTIFTILLFIAAFLGSGAYAVLSIADFRAARRGFWATAISFAAIGVVLGLMTTWPLTARISIAAVFAAVAFGSLVWVLDYLNIRERMGLENEGQGETGHLVSQAQFEKVREVESFFGGKDENGLRVVFDLQNILYKNITAQSARIALRRAGRANEFSYNNYTDNGQLIVWVKESSDLPPAGRPIVPGMAFGPSGMNPHEGPRDVRYLVTTAKYQSATAKLTEFQNSVLIPESIKKALKDFGADFYKNTDVMLRLFDDYLHQDEGYFINHWTIGSPFNNVINNEFVGRMTYLKPGADRVLDAISIVWKVNK